MSKYKFADADHKTVYDKESGDFGIHPGSATLWKKYENWKAEGGVTEPFKTPEEAKAIALASKVEELTSSLETSFDAGITFEGHHYYSDDITRRYLLEVATMIFILDIADNDPIPVEMGVWKTMEFQADGVTPVYVPMTVKQFKNFCAAFFGEGNQAFAKKEMKATEIRTKAADPNATAEDVNNIVIDI